MRYQVKSYRSQSYALRESFNYKDNKENNENTNTLNILPTKINRAKDFVNKVPLCQLKLQHHISDSTNNTVTVSSLLRRDSMPEELKKTYTQIIVKDYSSDIIEYLCSQYEEPKGLLDRHCISSSLRSKMIDWMIEVLSSYKMTEETFFCSVYLMDAFLKNSAERLEVKDLHLIGVTAMFAAAKYQQIHPLKLNVIYDKIARKKFKRDEILQKQSIMINTLDFKLESSSIYDIARYVIETMHLPFSQSSLKYLQKIILYLAKMTLFNCDLLKLDPSLLAGAVIFIGLKTLEQMDPTAEPEGRLPQICSLVKLKEEDVIEVSRKMLDLAKNFNKYFPLLNNLKKFNKFEYGLD